MEEYKVVGGKWEFSGRRPQRFQILDFRFYCAAMALSDI